MSATPRPVDASTTPARRPVGLLDLAAMRERREPIVMVTAHDFPSAQIAEEAEVDIVLVGDSAAMNVLGYDSTVPVTVDELLVLCRAVRRGLRTPLLVGDLPFGSYQRSDEQAIDTAIRFVKEAGCEGVKLEGGQWAANRARAMVDAGIPVMGHVGLTPQAVHQFGGFKVQRDATALLADAVAVEEAGAFSVVVESVPADIGTKITATVKIPTIGIGAGVNCDGQVLVFHDMMGLFPDFKPKFAKRYVDLGSAVKQAVESYCKEVRDGSFPATEHTFR